MVNLFLCCLLTWTLRASLIKYRGYELEFDCGNRTALRWRYNLTVDVGQAKRPSSFYKDPNLPIQCQQKATIAYGSGYDRGHLVTSNHMDFDDITIREAHYMTNIVPQIQTFNQGIWQETELITECYRDHEFIQIYGGLVYSDPSNDFFLQSHGIKTPEYFWKVLVSKNSQGQDISIAWYIPNEEDLKGLDTYVVTIDEIQEKLNDQLGPILPSPNGLENIKGSMYDWEVTGDCNPG